MGDERKVRDSDREKEREMSCCFIDTVPAAMRRLKFIKISFSSGYTHILNTSLAQTFTVLLPYLEDNSTQCCLSL